LIQLQELENFMDKVRRSIVIGTSALTLLPLAGCGGGDGNDAGADTSSTSRASGLAQAQSVPVSQALFSPYPAANSTIDNIFTSDCGGPAITPNAGIQAVLNDTTMWVSLQNTVTDIYGTKWTRLIHLKLNNVSLNTATATFTAGSNLELGQVVVNSNDLDNRSFHLDYEMRALGNVTVSTIAQSTDTATGITTGSFLLTFNNLVFYPTDATKLKSNSNTYARFPFQIVQAASVPFMVETVNWA
jgi:hypothetical protein